MGTEDVYITVGTLGKTRGVNGELFVTPLTDFPDRFIGLREIFVNVQGTWRRWKLESARLISGRPVLKFEGVDNLEDAERMTNRDLAVARSEAVPLPEGAYYIFDLTGCLVYDASDVQIGEVAEVRTYPANDVYVVKMTDGRQMLLPAIHQFVKQVNIEAKKIVIDTAGLIEGD